MSNQTVAALQARFTKLQASYDMRGRAGHRRREGLDG
jgi:hypothetical protein